MALTIENETDWDGRQLRTLCRRVIDATDGHRNRTIQIKTSRSRNKGWRWANAEGQGKGCRSGLYTGYAYLNTKYRPIYIGVPKVERKINDEWRHLGFDEIQFARVLEHEILHNQGLRHRDMIDDTRRCTQDVDHIDLDGITVEPKPSYEWRGDY